ncbi:heavy-metal-associated domain-containing protein [Streptomyces montanisoli]|uniref:Heavy-metal-associated domain-containing protein n=1 Tax=Streptomyces montanisoli TaxID=2798581 RepID=A0A940M4R2_9ACTN|nr:heavy-metal-associated domain-containing protein [Streptomyces montanisoli]MBP0456090.1 heavy-metal-associated domain-containing protein [Streptomyces montanisoli]
MSSCCTPDGSCHSEAGDQATGGVVTVYQVSGMSCGHCKTAITQAVGDLAAVRAVDVDVDAGRVTVTTDGAPDESVIAKAVDEAGYELTGHAA